jgi:hypothetical protein
MQLTTMSGRHGGRHNRAAMAQSWDVVGSRADNGPAVGHTTPDPGDPPPGQDDPVPQEVPQPDPAPVQDPIPHQVPLKA